MQIIEQASQEARESGSVCVCVMKVWCDGGVLNSQPLILIWQQILGIQTDLQCASVGLSWQTDTQVN